MLSTLQSGQRKKPKAMKKWRTYPNSRSNHMKSNQNRKKRQKKSKKRERNREDDHGHGLTKLMGRNENSTTKNRNKFDKNQTNGQNQIKK
jgi:hypothetical protein